MVYSKVMPRQFASCFHLCCDVSFLCMYLCSFQLVGASPNFSMSWNCFVCSHPCTYTHKFGIKRCRRKYSNHMLQPFMKILLTWDITAYHKRVYFWLTRAVIAGAFEFSLGPVNGSAVLVWLELDNNWLWLRCFFRGQVRVGTDAMRPIDMLWLDVEAKFLVDFVKTYDGGVLSFSFRNPV